jgi:hypothetical protein
MIYLGSMSRRRKPRTPASSSPPPNDGSPLGHLSDADLVKEFAREMARRRAAGGKLDLDAIESFATDVQRDTGGETLLAVIEALPPETTTAKPCPKCGAATPVKVRNRLRHILTTAGQLRMTRNYHYCQTCRRGFYPRDIELKLPEEGAVSDSMERRILDFGINDTFESAAERWAIHYPCPISSNLVRRVVDRVGLRGEAVVSELALQKACRPSPEEPVPALVVASDGSMVLTREEAWREAKVGVVAHLTRFPDDATHHDISSPRYVAVLGGKKEFAATLAAALEAEQADLVPQVVWLADGAPGNWTLATELCPLAIQVLDIIHAFQHGHACGKALLGDLDPALSLWEERIRHLIDASRPDALIHELLDCLPYTTTEAHLAALDNLVGYYRTNEERMQYARFRELGLPVGSGIVESAHRHVLQARMKRAGQRWSLLRGRRMTRLRAAYRTAGPRHFHAALRDATRRRARRPAERRLPSGRRRVQRTYKPSRVSPLGRKVTSN